MYIRIHIHINTYTGTFDRLHNIGLFSGTLQQERGSFFAVKKRFVFAVKKRLFLAAKKRLFEHTWYFSKHTYGLFLVCIDALRDAFGDAQQTVFGIVLQCVAVLVLRTFDVFLQR